MGTRYYLHYFYSPIQDNAYKLTKGSLQLLSMDRRDETTIDEVQRLGSIAELEELGIHPDVRRHREHPDCDARITPAPGLQNGRSGRGKIT